jgi:uncharacterized membrane protein (UPF0127 family)
MSSFLPALARRSWLAVAMLALAAAACERPAPGQEAAGGAYIPLVIESLTGVRHTFQVEVAETPAERTKGLMFRSEMAADAGMLFLYQAPQFVTMWMRNTVLPLDMLFITADGRILSIAERAVPQSAMLIPSDGAALGVLEVNAGTASRLGLGVGDRVLHAHFGTAP